MVDIFVVTVQGSYFGQLIINNFTYRIENANQSDFQERVGRLLFESMGGSPVASGDFASPSLFGDWQKLVNGAYFFESAYIRSPYTSNNFFETAFPPGVQGSSPAVEAGPSFAAFGFRSTRTNLNIRRSFKRFVGVGGDEVGIDNILSGGAKSRAQGLAGKMAQTLTLTDSLGQSTTATPVMLSKEPSVSPSGKKTYNYYADLQTQLDNTTPIVEFEVYETARTQVSRQMAKGK